MIIINNNKKHKYKLIDTWNRLVVARGRGGGAMGGKMGEGNKKVQTSSYKISKSRGCNVLWDDCS